MIFLITTNNIQFSLIINYINIVIDLKFKFTKGLINMKTNKIFIILNSLILLVFVSVNPIFAHEGATE